MMDYHAYFWAMLVYFGLLPGLIGAAFAGTRAWRRGAGPARTWIAAVKGFGVVSALAIALVLLFLGY